MAGRHLSQKELQPNTAFKREGEREQGREREGARGKDSESKEEEGGAVLLGERVSGAHEEHVFNTQMCNMLRD